MRKIITLLLLFISSQNVRGQISYFMIDSLPTYYLVSHDSCLTNSNYSTSPRHLTNELDLLDTNSFFAPMNSHELDSIFISLNSHLIEIESLKRTSFKLSKGKKKQWKLRSIRDYGSNSTCCYQRRQFHTIFFLDSENLIYSANEIIQTFEMDVFDWNISKRGEQFLTATYGYHNIGDDLAEGGTIFIFELIEGN